MKVPGLILILTYRGPNVDFCPVDLGDLVVHGEDFAGEFRVGESVYMYIQYDRGFSQAQRSGVICKKGECGHGWSPPLDP